MPRKRKTQGEIPKYIPNPEYLSSPLHAHEVERFKDALAVSGDCVEDYFPADYGKAIPATGAWIMLLADVDVGEMLPDQSVKTIHVPHMSMWYALPAFSNFSRSVDDMEVHASMAVINHPDGEVRIWPHEYNIVRDITKYLEFTEADGFYINFIDQERGGFDDMKLFYLRSRGIPLGEARKMLIGELASPHFCYFTFHEEYATYYPQWTGSPYAMRVAESRRRFEQRSKA